jgi:hypothetical protein
MEMQMTENAEVSGPGSAPGAAAAAEFSMEEFFALTDEEYKFLARIESEGGFC